MYVLLDSASTEPHLIRDWNKPIHVVCFHEKVRFKLLKNTHHRCTACRAGRIVASRAHRPAVHLDICGTERSGVGSIEQWCNISAPRSVCQLFHRYEERFSEGMGRGPRGLGKELLLSLDGRERERVKEKKKIIGQSSSG